MGRRGMGPPGRAGRGDRPVSSRVRRRRAPPARHPAPRAGRAPPLRGLAARPLPRGPLRVVVAHGGAGGDPRRAGAQRPAPA
ncbi:MAG: hypothetical protein ACK559_09435, partial [bacterium]